MMSPFDSSKLSNNTLRSLPIPRIRNHLNIKF
jgi:hypothetical protein